ncbi:hypothetical protein COLO4_13543 [Corchorus olitorius]|uniref:Pentatricopeptide repeat-containing protein n=1 Tax=Corchorus olitorius TaxID=93759 RepID=A0A1R3JW71_9ROSI|nr:hypothetical protein COLO4_13543 [Corchorus olitorius]
MIKTTATTMSSSFASVSGNLDPFSFSDSQLSRICCVARFSAFDAFNDENVRVGLAKSFRSEELIIDKCKSRYFKLDLALVFFDSMISINPLTSAQAFNTSPPLFLCVSRLWVIMTMSMNCFCNLKQIDLSLSVLAMVFNVALQSHSHTINVLPRLCIEGDIDKSRTEWQGSVDKSLIIFRDMFDGGAKPNEITYHRAINGYCLQGEIDKANSVFDLMGKTKDEASRNIEELVQKGMIPGSVAHKLLIKIWSIL